MRYFFQGNDGRRNFLGLTIIFVNNEAENRESVIVQPFFLFHSRQRVAVQKEEEHEIASASQQYKYLCHKVISRDDGSVFRTCVPGSVLLPQFFLFLNSADFPSTLFSWRSCRSRISCVSWLKPLMMCLLLACLVHPVHGDAAAAAPSPLL
jgi:hypothetical protein